MSEHIPVLVKEVMNLLNPKTGDTLLDATLGHGGHARAFLDAAQDTRVIGVDADEAALASAKENLIAYGERVTYLLGNFYNLPKEKTQAILFDLGIGSHQISDSGRGFSFKVEGPLNMMYGEHEDLPESWLAPINVLTKRLGHYPNAQELLDGLSPIAITDVLRTYGEERYAGVIANAICSARPIAGAKQLATIIADAVPKSYEHGRIHPATRTFQALRIAVNRELEVLEAVLPKAVGALASGGVLAVISFHSLEDRIVKRYFKKESAACICLPEQPICVCNHPPTVQILTKKPVTATQEEQKINPRARSAKLRGVKKI